MIHNYFKKYPLAYNYFSTLIEQIKENKSVFPQSIILEGENTQDLYFFALELARNINCENDGSDECKCTNCNWIKTHTHPAIQNVSQIHFKGEDDDTKTAISVKQARRIESSLTFSSDYHRFFIFFSAEERQSENGTLNYSKTDFTIKPLDTKVFGQQCANTLLKSIEEPPKNTTFVFLTNTKANILSTIVSRCQTFKLAETSFNLEYSEILDLIKPYPNIKYTDALEISSGITDKVYNMEEFLNKFIAYIIDLIKKHPNSYYQLNRDTKYIADAIRHIKANVSEKNAVEALFLKIAKDRI